VKLPDGTHAINLDADPHNANWLRINAAQRLSGHRLPMWAAMWLRALGHDEEDDFWRQVGHVADTVGYSPWDEGQRGSRNDSLVIGVDGTPGGWLAVALRDGTFHEAVAASSVQELLDEFPAAAVVAVDIPIGLPERGQRAADLLAQRVLGPRRSS